MDITEEPIKILGWRPLSKEIDDRVLSVLNSWERTPYRDLDRIKGMGVDCFQIVAAFLDEMARVPLGTTKLPRLSSSIARNRPDIARGAIRDLRRSHEGSETVVDGIVEPGDIIVVRSILATDGPMYEGHTMIAGTKPNTLLHAIRPRVCWSGWGTMEVVRIYRPKNKDSLWK